MEFVGDIDVDFVEKGEKVAKGGGFDFVGVKTLRDGLRSGF